MSRDETTQGPGQRRLDFRPGYGTGSRKGVVASEPMPPVAWGPHYRCARPTPYPGPDSWSSPGMTDDPTRPGRRSEQTRLPRPRDGPADLDAGIPPTGIEAGPGFLGPKIAVECRSGVGSVPVR
jgi:hypothetical protein